MTDCLKGPKEEEKREKEEEMEIERRYCSEICSMVGFIKYKLCLKITQIGQRRQGNGVSVRVIEFVMLFS